MELPSKIDGPVSMYIYHLRGDINKLVIMIGDEHSLPKYGCKTCSEDCRKLPVFLKQIFKKSKICIDFFLEFPFIPKGSGWYKSGDDQVLLAEIRREFEKCLLKTKDECARYGNVRMHYSDIRQFLSSNLSNLLGSLGYLHPDIYHDLKRLVKIKCKTTTQLTEDQKRTLDRMFFNLNTSKTTQIIEYVIGLRDKLPPNSEVHDTPDEFREFQKNKISKQLKVLPNYLRESILEEYSQNLSSFINSYIGYLKNLIISIIHNNICSSRNITHLVIFTLGVIGSPMMDVYLLARLLKPSLSDSRIAIIYAGDNHIRNYNNFFNKRPFVKTVWLQVRKDPIVKCIKIPKEIVQEVKKITEKYPSEKCSTKKLLENAEKEIAKIHDVSPEKVHRCLQETSKIHLEPLWKVTGIVLNS